MESFARVGNVAAIRDGEGQDGSNGSEMLLAIPCERRISRHNQQELKAEDGVHFFDNGGGGAGLYNFNYPDYSHSNFKAKKNGLTILEADDHQLVIRLISDTGEEIHKSTFHK